MARTAFVGSDLQAMFEIERDNIERVNAEAITLGEKAVFNSAAIRTASGLRLSTGQLDAIELTAKPVDIAARRMKMGKSTYTARIRSAAEQNDMLVEELLEKAMQDSLIDISPLEKRERPVLNSDEELLLELVLYARKNGEDIEWDPEMKETFSSACEKLGVRANQPALIFVIAKHFDYI